MSPATRPVAVMGCGHDPDVRPRDSPPVRVDLLASSLDTEPAMITSSPCCQLTGVATRWLGGQLQRVDHTQHLVEVAPSRHRVDEDQLDLLVWADDEHVAHRLVVGRNAASAACRGRPSATCAATERSRAAMHSGNRHNHQAASPSASRSSAPSAPDASNAPNASKASSHCDPRTAAVARSSATTVASRSAPTRAVADSSTFATSATVPPNRLIRRSPPAAS